MKRILKKHVFSIQKIWSDGSLLTYRDTWNSTYDPFSSMKTERFKSFPSSNYGVQLRTMEDVFDEIKRRNKAPRNWTNKSYFISDRNESCAVFTGNAILMQKWIGIACDDQINEASFVCENPSYVTKQFLKLNRNAVECHENEVFTRNTCVTLRKTTFIKRQSMSRTIENIDTIILDAWTQSYIHEPYQDFFSQINVYVDNKCHCLKRLSFLFLDKGRWHGFLCNCPHTGVYSIVVRKTFVSKISCGDNQFQCQDKTCILSKYKCDGNINCPDGSDEYCNQVFKNKILCTFPRIQCNDLRVCIDPLKMCDGHADCTDHSDEITCKQTLNEIVKVESYAYICPDGWSLCDNRYIQCFPDNYICIFDKNNIYCPNTEHLRKCSTHVCPASFKCKHSYCIPLHHVCDDVSDCPNDEDEVICSKLTCEGLLLCKNDDVCVHPNQICDGRIDCVYSQDDESLCSSTHSSTYCHLNNEILHCTGGTLLHLHYNTQNLKGIKLEKMQVDYHWFKDLNFISLSIASFSKSHFPGKKIIPNMFIKSFNLYSLDLSYTNIIYLTTNNFAKLTKLRWLQVKGCSIIIIDEHSFTNLIYIQLLDLSAISLRVLQPRSLCDLYSTKKIDLSKNALKIIKKYTFCCLDSLLTLNLSNNDLVFMEHSVFNELMKLNQLYVNTMSQCCYSAPSQQCNAKQIELHTKCNDILLGYIALKWMYIVIGFLASTLNGTAFVLKVFVKHLPKERRFSQNLALSDSLIGIFILTTVSKDYASNNDYITLNNMYKIRLFCNFVGLIPMTGIYMSHSLLLFISLQRLIVIKYGLSKNIFHMISRNNQYIIITTAWLASLSFAYLNVYNSQTYNMFCFVPFYSEHFLIGTLPISAIIIVVFTFSVLLLVVSVYITIFKYIKSVQVVSECKSSRSHKAYDSRVLWRTFIIILLHFIGWLCLVGLCIVSVFTDSVYAKRIALVIFLPINSIINPCIYTFTFVKIKLCK